MRQSSLNKGWFVFHCSGNDRQVCLRQRWAFHLAISHLGNTNSTQHLISLLGELGWLEGIGKWCSPRWQRNAFGLSQLVFLETTSICKCSLATRSSQAEVPGNYFLCAGNSHFRTYSRQVHLQYCCATWREAGSAPQCWSTSVPVVIWEKELPSLESREWRLQPNPRT